MVTLPLDEPLANPWVIKPANELVIGNIIGEEGTKWTIPNAQNLVSRIRYFYQGDTVVIDGQPWLSAGYVYYIH